MGNEDFPRLKEDLQYPWYFICCKTPSIPTSHMCPFLRFGCILEWTASLNHHLSGSSHDVVSIAHAFTKLVITILMANSWVVLLVLYIWLRVPDIWYALSKNTFIEIILFASKHSVIVYVERKAWEQQGVNLILVKQMCIVGEITEVPQFLSKQQLEKDK